MTTHATHTSHIRGHRAVTLRPSVSAIGLALFFDLAWAAGIAAVVIRLLDLAPVPTLAQFLALFALIASLTALQLFLLKSTLGQALLRLKWRAGRLVQTEKLDTSARLTALVTTIVVAGAAVFAAREFVYRHPLLIYSLPLEIKPFAPDLSGWSIRSYFYSLGAWPSRFAGHPVLYTVPYEKGPPQQFLGRLIAHWDSPLTKVTFEGPKTPLYDGLQLDPARLQLCLSDSAVRSEVSCLRIREAALFRHIREIRAEIRPRPGGWKLHWFEVRNPVLPATEWPRGIYVAASNGAQAQERYILVNPKGVHQAMILDRQETSAGEQASEVLRQSIGSQRVQTSLNAGKAWANRELSETRIGELASLSNEEFASQISSVQSLLISKISVEPSSFDAYFHLGGISLLLHQRAAKTGNLDWSAVARPNIQSALHFAQDLAEAKTPSPADQTRLDQLTKMVKEVGGQ